MTSQTNQGSIEALVLNATAIHTPEAGQGNYAKLVFNGEPPKNYDPNQDIGRTYLGFGPF